MNSKTGAFQLRLNIRGLVCFVDGDEIYLQTMMAAYTGDRKAIAFQNPDDAARRLREDNQRLVDMERDLAGIFAEESFPTRIRRMYAWLMNVRRHDCVEVCFCDFALPKTTGTILLSTVPRSRIRRVLLSGEVLSLDAMNAMNAGHIDFYLPKDVPHRSREILTHSNNGPILQVDGLWGELAPGIRQLMELSAVRAKLWAQLEALDVDEHILLPMPLGFLCRTKAGKGLWVQLEVGETQLGAAEILREQGLSEEDVMPILQRQKTACLEVLPALHASDEALAAWSDIEVVNESPWLGMAVFELPEPVSVDATRQNALAAQSFE